MPATIAAWWHGCRHWAPRGEGSSRRGRAFGLAALAGFVTWECSAQQARFLLPVALLVLPAAAEGLKRLSQLRLRPLVAGLLVGACLCSMSRARWLHFWSTAEAAFHVGNRPRVQDFVFTGTADAHLLAMKAIWELTPEDARVLLLFDPRGLYCPRAHLVGTPLFQPDLVRAQVLGEELSCLWRGQKLIGAGTHDGIRELTLVLDDKRPILDQGADARVAADQPVYAGRIVVGKVAATGRWSSTLRLVTDAGYIGSARLARRTSQGTVFSSEGKLEGDGTRLCRLKYIQSTEPVREGDLVFTGETDGVHPCPMYYGTVARAELEEGTSHWSIWVKPAVLDEKLETVQVLRTALNRNRLLAD